MLNNTSFPSTLKILFNNNNLTSNQFVDIFFNTYDNILKTNFYTTTLPNTIINTTTLSLAKQLLILKMNLAKTTNNKQHFIDGINQSIIMYWNGVILNFLQAHPSFVGVSNIITNKGIPNIINQYEITHIDTNKFVDVITRKLDNHLTTIRGTHTVIHISSGAVVVVPWAGINKL